MAVELKQKSKVAWPSNVRLPVLLTFEHQSGEGTPLIFGDRPNYMVGDAMQYGGRRGLWNILELLKKHNVKATIFVAGNTAALYPEAVRAAKEEGHELAGMGYRFERVRTASPDQQREIFTRVVRTVQDVAGTQIRGWRCPDYRVGPQTIDLLAEAGFLWDSSLLNDDLPYFFDHQGTRLVEIPFTTTTADKTFIGYPHPQRGGPDGLADVWKSEFDTLYQESESAPRMLILSMQTWAVGRPALLPTLERFLKSVSSHSGIWYARCGEVAQWWRDQSASRLN